MLILVTGGAASGKSAYAEGLAIALSEQDGGKRVYLATMPPAGEESRARIEKHRRMREGKGFLTIERTRNVAKLMEPCFDAGGTEDRPDAADGISNDIPAASAILLEDLSNLLANELFTDIPPEGAAYDENRNARIIGAKNEPENMKKERFENAPFAEVSVRAPVVSEKIFRDILALRESTRHLVVVTNEIFSDGICYDADTEAYIEALGNLNIRIAAAADAVVEVIYGIPVARKGKDLLPENGLGIVGK